MDGALFARTFPGATTCVIIGAPTRCEALDSTKWRNVLWLAVEADASDGWAFPIQTERLPLENVSLEELKAHLTRFIRHDARRLPSVFVFPTSSTVEENRLTSLLELLFSELNAHHRARVTREADGFRWQAHLLANLPFYARRPLPLAWKGALAGMPAAICGAGPSLDVSAPELAARGAGCVVFAADSALRTLARHGVRVDFAVSIDVAKAPAKCLPEGETPPRVLLSSVSPPEWRAAVPESSCFYLANRQVTTDWLATLGVPRPPVAVAENCGATALELARWMGCAPIYLFGLDLALSGKERHTSGAERSIYVASGFDAAQEFPDVPGNWSDTVPTHAIGDWRALDERLAEWPAGVVVNVNDRGARLRGAPVVRPDAWAGASDAGAKRAALAALPSTSDADASRWAEARAGLVRAGARVGEGTRAARAALAAGGPDACAKILRTLLADAETARALGSFALKLMPHLVPPTEGEAARWAGWLDELESLSVQLAQLR